MEKLFSYGTLQMENVQKETFGRLLEGKKDILLGYVLSEVKINDEEVIKKSGEQKKEQKKDNQTLIPNKQPIISVLCY